MAFDELRAALARFGLTAGTTAPITSGAVNEHWRVQVNERLYVLRRYRLRHDSSGTLFEHAALAHVAARGWPVAEPLPAAAGGTVVELDGRRYSLFPFLPGRPLPAGDRWALREKGTLLARLHRDLASWSETRQRPGFARVSDLDTYIAPDRFGSVDALLEWYARDDAPLTKALRRERAANLEELDWLGFATLPDTPIHFEFYGANLLFKNGVLSAVLDWDFVHRDARVSDIGRGAVIDCAAPDGGIDPDALAAFLAGYCAETPLNEAELRLIVPALRANLLWLAVLPLSLWAAGDPAPYLLPSARRTAGVQLPRLRAQQSALTAAITTAASEGGRDIH